MYAFDPHEDWAHLLCHGRQLLGYRIVINCLLPTSERYQLLEVLGLLRHKAGLTEQSKLTSENLVRQSAFAFFGLAEDETKVKCHIDIVRNLIQLSDKLEALPSVVCVQLRRFLKANPGILPSGTPAKTAVISIDEPGRMVSWSPCHMNVNRRTGPARSQDNRTPLPSQSNWSMFREMSSEASEWMITPPPTATATRRRNTSNFST